MTRMPLCALALASLLGCRHDSGDDDFADDDSAGDDDSTGDDDPGGDDDSGPNVEEIDDPSATWDCDQVGGSAACVGDYVALAESMLEEGFDLDACREATTAYVLALLDGSEPLPDPLDAWKDPWDLGEDVASAIGLDVLLEGIDGRPLLATRAASWSAGGATERRLLLTDPLVGTFEMRTLEPDGESAPDAVIGMPGHPLSADQVDDFLDQHHGRAYADAGYMVAVVSFRGYDSGPAEHLATTSLLCAGLSMMAIRSYETLLADKYLRWLRGRGRVGGIAGIGHSEGSCTGNLLARAVPTWDAWVRDLTTSYINAQPCSGAPDSWCLVGETVPSVYEYHWLVNELSDPEPIVPTLEQPYAYDEGPDAVLEFLAQHMDPAG